MNKFKDALENPEISYLIGETAYIHEGDYDYLLKFVDELIEKECCDGIKFHVLAELDSYVTPSHELYDLYKRLMMPREDWIKLFKHIKSKKVEIIVMVDDYKALEFIKEHIDLVDAVELHAIALNNLEMLERVKDISVPIVLGVGGSQQEDIEFAVQYLNRKDILLMHGFQNYPTKYEYANFTRMQKLKEKFGLPVGYADHTAWDDPMNEWITLAGFMAGANVLEKHATPEPGKKRVDFESAISIEQLKDIYEKMHVLNTTRGDGSFEISAYENVYAKNGPMKFTIVASKDLKKGAMIQEGDLTFRRTGEKNTIKQRDFTELVGCTLQEDVPKNGLVNWEKVEKK